MLPDNILRKGRGATRNIDNRYAPTRITTVDDGWHQDDDLPLLRTTVTEQTCRSIISRNNSPDIPFSQSINPYAGCEHGCVYCYARPSHAYLELSPGLDFETRLFAKTNAAERLQLELSRPGYRVSPINIGANTDPYQPIERDYRLTRQILEVLGSARHPVTIITKSYNILKDIDILSRLAADNLVSVMMSVTSLDNELARRLEPRASSPARRLQALQTLTAAGIPCGVLTAPMIPALNDHELESILEKAASAGARQAAWMLLRLPLEVSDLFQSWLEEHYPLKKEHVLSLIRQQRGGQLYRAGFGERMRGEGEFARLMSQRFRIACRRLGMNEGETPPLRTDLFVPPPRPNVPDPTPQMALF